MRGVKSRFKPSTASDVSSDNEGIALRPLTAFTPRVQLNERRHSALTKIDRAPFSWFHVKVWLVAGVGFFTDAYDIFAIGIGALMIGNVYGNGGSLPPLTDLGLKIAMPIGNVFGQLGFGILADRVGRKRMYGVELSIIVASCFAQALTGSGPALNAIGVLTVWRFCMGVGIGGDYPLSAVITSEFAATRSRGRLMTAVFASQGWGNLAASIVALVVLSIYKGAILSEGTESIVAMDRCWRFLIGLGCVPGVIAIYFRLTVPETPRFTMDVVRDIKQAVQNIQAVLSAYGVQPGVWEVDESRRPTSPIDAPRASWSDFKEYFGRWENLRVLIGCSYSWFALDVAFYGLGLNTSKVLTASLLSAIGIQESHEPSPAGSFNNIYNITLFTLLIAGTSLIPGYWATFLLVDRWGRRPIQLMGFAVLFVLFLIMGFGYNALMGSEIGSKVFVFIYCLANFFQNFGPNTTTFIIPGEAFPTRYRATAHGISAASGKFGAIVAQIIFYMHGDSIRLILRIFAFIMLSGIFSTLLLPETKGRSLEEISNEKQSGFIRGVNAFELRNGIVLKRVH
ncbi:phosphate transporter [Peniophora sp. CONT]|nr:phosphate transporter [Peniophora sp. CONT]